MQRTTPEWESLRTKQLQGLRSVLTLKVSNSNYDNNKIKKPLFFFFALYLKFLAAECVFKEILLLPQTPLFTL